MNKILEVDKMKVKIIKSTNFDRCNQQVLQFQNEHKCIDISYYSQNEEIYSLGSSSSSVANTRYTHTAIIKYESVDVNDDD